MCEYGLHREVKQVDELKSINRSSEAPFRKVEAPIHTVPPVLNVPPVHTGPPVHIPAPANTITGVPTSVTAFVGRAASGPVGQPVLITSFGGFQTTFGGLWQGSELGYAVADFFSNGGTQALVVRLQNASSAADPLRPVDYLPAGGASSGQGLYALQQLDAFNLLVLSPDRGSSGSIDVNASVIASAAAYCEQRLAMLLIDAPVAWTTAASAQAAMASPAVNPFGTSSSNAALFFPHLQKPDPLAGNVLKSFAPSGAVAGVISHTDTARGVWKAPAGIDAALAGTSGLSLAITDAQNGVLQSVAINCMRTLPQIGIVVWGARTLSGAEGSADQFRYIPVRRVALYLEQSLRSGLAWITFEPNDEALWSSIRLRVEAFLHEMFLQGAFQGITPSLGYFVKCDADTTTQADVVAGVVNVEIGFAPLAPAEFVVLSLQLISGLPLH